MIDSPTVDPLDREIADRSAAIAAKERELELERVELRALQRAAMLRPVAKMNGAAHPRPQEHHQEDRLAEQPAKRSKGKARGKVAGTISNQWRQVMARAVELGNDLMPAEGWVMVADLAGYQLTPRGTADWLRRGVGAQLGFIERRGDNYRVSETAIEKFGFQPAAERSQSFTEPAAVAVMSSASFIKPQARETAE
jgi:hypothetical protein